MKHIFTVAMLAVCAGPSALAQTHLLPAGEAKYELTGIMIVEQLPKAWTQSRFSNIAAAKPAPPNHVYVVIKGTVTNQAAQDRNLTSAFLWLEDGAGNKYKNDGSGTVIYQPQGTGIALIKVPAGATKPWVGFFPVPKGATGMKLLATDLKFRNAARAEYSLPDALPGKPSRAPVAAAAPIAPSANSTNAAPAPSPSAVALNALTPQTVAGVWMLDEAFSKKSADGNTAGLMKRVTVNPDGTFVAMYGIKGKWRIAGGHFLVTYDSSAATRKDEEAALSANHVKWPSPSDRKKFCYMLKTN